MKYKLVIFDFDGTLADSFPWFIKMMDVVTEKFNLMKIDKDQISELRKLDSLSFLKHLKIPLYKLPKISTFMRNMMSEHIDEIKLFPGVENMFHELKEKGYKIAVVSTNSKDNIIKVLGESLYSMNDHFVGGVSVFGKDSKLKKVLKMSGIDKKDAIYIGDELRDIQASKKVGIPCGSVTWGVNDADALAALSPDEMFYEVEQILQRV
ncbi:MAG: HAD hydrolase-like protein [Candidatus Cloacimonadota bacterium]|nr:HAD hydrolase-like protein [Candidatus Cloacimonadota bacterium]